MAHFNLKFASDILKGEYPFDKSDIKNRVDIKMLEDLIVAAQHDAVSNMQQLIQEKAGPMFSGMNIPGFN